MVEKDTEILAASIVVWELIELPAAIAMTEELRQITDADDLEDLPPMVFGRAAARSLAHAATFSCRFRQAMSRDRTQDTTSGDGSIG